MKLYWLVDWLLRVVRGELIWTLEVGDDLLELYDNGRRSLIVINGQLSARSLDRAVEWLYQKNDVEHSPLNLGEPCGLQKAAISQPYAHVP